MSTLLGLAEVAKLLGVSRQRVGQLIETHRDFPRPEAELASGRIWRRSEVDEWLAVHPERRPGRSRQQGFGFDRLTDRARSVLVHAQAEARELRHDYLGCEHLLLGLVDLADGPAYRCLHDAGVSRERVLNSVLQLIGTGTGGDSQPFTPRAVRALQLGASAAIDLGHSYIAPEHLLLGILAHRDNVAAHMLDGFGVPAQQLRQALAPSLGGVLSESRGSLAESQTDLGELKALLLAISSRLERIEARLDVLERQ